MSDPDFQHRFPLGYRNALIWGFGYRNTKGQIYSITAVADVFETLSSKRPYKSALPMEECFAIMKEGRGNHFDPRVLDAFLACREEIVKRRLQSFGMPLEWLWPRPR